MTYAQQFPLATVRSMGADVNLSPEGGIKVAAGAPMAAIEIIKARKGDVIAELKLGGFTTSSLNGYLCRYMDQLGAFSLHTDRSEIREAWHMFNELWERCYEATNWVSLVTKEESVKLANAYRIALETFRVDTQEFEGEALRKKAESLFTKAESLFARPAVVDTLPESPKRNPFAKPSPSESLPPTLFDSPKPKNPFARAHVFARADHA